MSGASMALSYDDQAVQAVLAQLAALGGDLSEAMGDIGAGLEGNVRLRFAAGQGPGGVAWTPSQRAIRENGKTLVDTERLLKSMTHVYGADFAEVGTNTAYAAIHQFGGGIHREARTQTLYWYQYAGGEVGRRFVKKGRSNFSQDAEVGAHDITMPARPFLGFDDADEDEAVAAITRRIEEAMTP